MAMQNNMQRKTLVTSVIGADTHIVGIQPWQARVRPLCEPPRVPRQRPFHLGSRFSAKARMPSIASSPLKDRILANGELH